MAEDRPSSRQSDIATHNQRLDVLFEDLKFTVPLKKRSRTKGSPTTKVLLDGVTGAFKAGRLTAIMGASGAGKTTLLSVLAGNSGAGVLEGRITVNGQECPPNDLREMSGFVFQEDVLLPFMKVREAIAMSAHLRLPESVHRRERIDRIEDTINALRLNDAKSTIVGSALRKGISGGERKRTAIGMELVTNPSILFLDEPTTGLDTYTAFMVIKVLSDLAHAGRTVVATIHQPSTEIFNLFDDLVLLSRGRMAYMGPASQSVAYFASRGYQCPQYSNPGDYFSMHVLREFGCVEEHDSDNEDAIQQDDDGEIDPNSAVFRRSVGERKCDERIDRMLSEWQKSTEAGAITDSTSNGISDAGWTRSQLRTIAPFIRQLRLLSGRSAKSLMRNYFTIIARLAQAVFLGLILGLSYADTNDYGVLVQIFNKSGALFFYAVNVFYSSAIQVMSIFSEEKQVFYREYNNGYYYISTYYIGKTFVEIPGQVVGPYLFLIIAYYIVGFSPPFSDYLLMGTLGALGGLCGGAFGTLLAALFDDLTIALSLLPAIIMPLLLVSGVFVAQLKGWVKWLRYISPIYYTFAGMLDTQFSNDFLNCDPATENCSGSRAFTELNYTSVFPPGVDIVFLVTIFAVLWALGFIALYIGARFRRH